MTFPFGTTATILRDTPGGLDAYGDPVASTTSTTAVVGCALEDRYSTEPTVRGRQGVIVGKTLYAPAGTDIQHTDRILVGGLTYLVDGEAGEPLNPFTGWAPGVVVALRRVAG